jgi:hypothetical protein
LPAETPAPTEKLTVPDQSGSELAEGEADAEMPEGEFN